MRVDKQIMYHISRENNWNVGDRITAGIEDNPFWLACINYSPKETQGKYRSHKTGKRIQ